MRLLAIADEIADALWGHALEELRPDVIVACGDLPFDYLGLFAGIALAAGTIAIALNAMRVGLLPRWMGFLGMFILFGYLITYVAQSLKLMRVDRYAGTLYLGLFFQQAIMNLSESSWLTVNSAFLFAIMTMATLCLGRKLLDARLR